MSVKEDPLRTLLLDAQRRIRQSANEVLETTRGIEAELINALEGNPAAAHEALRAGGERFDSYTDYRRMLRRVRAAVRAVTTPRSVVVVVSKGDDELLSFHERAGWHFPQMENGAYAGHYPSSSAAAIDHLETLRGQGAQFLVLPATARWWLEHYAAFGQHLDARYDRIHDDEHCIIFRLAADDGSETHLDALRRNWHEYGRRDPLWAIMSVRGKINRKWEEAEFFRTGETEVARVMRYVESLRVPLARGRALDFGCGVGRLTQALCLYFDECCGVDIAPSMIELAAKYNRHASRCRYFLNTADDLRLFDDESFDFVYSSLVLQHMPREFAEKYVREFIRVLTRGGLAIFQLPSERTPGQSGIARKRSSASRPLPARAFRAAITTHKPAIEAGVAMQIPVRVKVRNLSDVTWPALDAPTGKYGVRLGSKWLDAGGIIISSDDGRAYFPHDLRASEEVELSVVVNTPTERGDYVLELDLVQEGVAWFKHKGSEALRIPVRVEADEKVSAGADETRSSSRAIPQMEMHGTPKTVVLGWIESGGGILVDVRNDRTAGGGWRGFRYCVTRK